MKFCQNIEVGKEAFGFQGLFEEPSYIGWFLSWSTVDDGCCVKMIYDEFVDNFFDGVDPASGLFVGQFTICCRIV